MSRATTSRRAFVGTLVGMGLAWLAVGCDSGPAPIPLEQFSGAKTLAVRFVDRGTGEFIDVVGPRATIAVAQFGAGRDAQRDRWQGTLDRDALFSLAKWAEGNEVLRFTGPDGSQTLARFRTPPRFTLEIDREDGRIAIGWNLDDRWNDSAMRGKVNGAVSALRSWAEPLARQ